jgi:CheY-like chemotaxis protein/glycine cleavage system H lipoate-binding protein
MSAIAKILVVDDELPVCKSVASALADSAYAVDTALSGEEALRKCREIGYDVIITDLMMPGISGMELLKAVHNIRADTRVIMITGYPSIQSAVQAIKLGAFDYIPKPFTPDELRSLVARARARKDVPTGKTDFSIPEGLWCIPDNAWIKIEYDGTVRAGAHHNLVNAIKAIRSVELPSVNETRYQGEACALITDSKKHVHRMWTPVTGRVVAINNGLQDNLSKLKNDPYGDGWLVILAPTNLDEEKKNLAMLKE